MAVKQPWEEDPLDGQVIQHNVMPDPVAKGGAAPAAGRPPYPEMPAAPTFNEMDPRKMLWGGVLMDLGNHFLTGQKAGLQGWGMEAYMGALKHNRQNEAAKQAYEMERWKAGKPDYKVFGGEKTGYYSYDVNNPGRPVEQLVPGVGNTASERILPVSPKDATFDSMQKFNEHLRKTGIEDYSLLEARNPWKFQVNSDGTAVAWNEQDPNQKLILRTPEEVSNTQGLLDDQATAQEFLRGYGADRDQAMTSINEIRELVSMIQDEQLKTGPAMTTEAKALFDARYQVLRAKLNNYGLKNIATLAEQGVKLNPITVEELKLLLSSEANLGNYSEANLELLLDKAAKIEEVVMKLDHRRDFLTNGGRFSEYKGFFEDTEVGVATGDDGGSILFQVPELGETYTLDELEGMARDNEMDLEDLMIELGVQPSR